MGECWHLRLDPAAMEAVRQALDLHARLEAGSFEAASEQDYGNDPERLGVDRIDTMTRALEELGSRALRARAGHTRALRACAERIAAGMPLDESDLVMISEASELLCRVHLGQWDIALEKLAIGNIDDYSDLREALGRRSNPCVASRACAAQARTAWDVHQVLRRHLAYRRHPEGGWQVIFDPPLKIGPAALAQVEAQSTEISHDVARQTTAQLQTPANLQSRAEPTF